MRQPPKQHHSFFLSIHPVHRLMPLNDPYNTQDRDRTFAKWLTVILDLEFVRVGYRNHSAIGSKTNTIYTIMRSNELAYDGDRIRPRRRVHQ